MADDRSDRSGKSAKKGGKSPVPTPRQLSSLDADVQQIHLFAAVRAEKLDTIRKLVPPASLQTHELSTGETPLHVAVDTGHAKVVELLLKLGADPGYPDKDGEGVFHRLMSKKEWKREEEKIFKMLIDCKETNADTGTTSLHEAVLTGKDDKLITTLIKKGGKPKLVGPNCKSEPILFSAARAQNKRLLQALIEAGADMAQLDEEGRSIMDIVNNKSRVFPYLVEQLEKAPFALKKLQQQAMAERFLIVTKPEELPQEIKKAVNQAQLTYDIVNKNWEPFCLVIRLLFNKRLVPSQEAADAMRDKDAQEATALANSQVPVEKEQAGIRNDEPKKVFNPRKLELTKQADTAYIYATRAPDRTHCCIKRTANATPEEVTTNVRECYYLRLAQHPNVPRFIAAYESANDKELWICTEWLRGADLEELLDAIADKKDKHLKLGEKHVAYIASELLTLLTWLHDTKRIVHRALRLSNIFLCKDGTVKLLDWGSAGQLREEDTFKGLGVWGSDYWVPPEMARRGSHTFSADIWSFGVSMGMLANNGFPSVSPLRHFMLMLTPTGIGKTYQPVLEPEGKFSDLLRDFVGLCLKADPAERPSAAKLAVHPFLSSATRDAKHEIGSLLEQAFHQEPQEIDLGAG